jgi:ribosomal protein S21
MDAFPDSASVNEALRSLKKIATRTARPTQSKPAQSRPAPRQRKTASASR